MKQVKNGSQLFFLKNLYRYVVVALLLILFVVLTKKCREATLDFTFWSTNKYYENADNAVLNDTFKFTICAS